MVVERVEAGAESLLIEVVLECDVFGETVTALGEAGGDIEDFPRGASLLTDWDFARLGGMATISATKFGPEWCCCA